MDFWDAEIMKIVLLLKRGLNFPFFNILKKVEKSIPKGTPKFISDAERHRRTPRTLATDFARLIAKCWQKLATMAKIMAKTIKNLQKIVSKSIKNR